MRESFSGRRRFLLAVVLMCHFLSSLSLFAGDGIEFPVVPQTKKNKKSSGLAAKFDGYGWSGGGYRTVRLTIKSIPPATRERKLSVHIAPNSYRRSDTPLEVSTPVTLPVGHTSSSVDIQVPQYERWNSMRVELHENGRPVEDATMDYANQNFATSRSYYAFSETYPTLLFIDSDAPRLADKESVISNLKLAKQSEPTRDLPDVRSLALWVSPYQMNNLIAATAATPQSLGGLEAGTDLENLEFVQQLPKWELVPPAELPRSWLGLTSVDVAFISASDLATLSDQYPNRFQSLAHYVHTGGTLIVLELDNEFSELSNVDELLPSGQEWFDPVAKAETGVPLDSQEVFDVMVENGTGYLAQNSSIAIDMSAESPDESMYRQRDYGLGTIIAVAGSEPFYGKNKHWNWLLGQLGPNRWMWYRRHGVSFQRSNDDYWKFLIPGLGAAPVKTFLFLIMGFAFLIGPVNYWLLRRTGRLYLLLVTVPGAALCLTLGMLLYVVVQDGFSTRMRARSYTLLDAERPSAVSWSRQSYYSGLAPPGGITYPQEAAIFPIYHDPNREKGSRRQMRWDGGRQVLSQGYHRSRTLSQFLVVYPQATEIGVDVRQADDGSKLRVVNRLGVPIEAIVVSGKNGVLYLAQEIDRDAEATALPTTLGEASDVFAPIANASKGKLPAGFDADYHTRSFSGMMYRSYTWNGDENFDDPTVETSVLELQLKALGLRDPLANRTFLAVTTAAPPTVPLGIENSEQQASCHLIKGSW